jgi:hypothetical protein
VRAASSNGGITWRAQMRLVDEVGADFDGLSQLCALIAAGRKAAVASEDVIAIFGNELPARENSLSGNRQVATARSRSYALD